MVDPAQTAGATTSPRGAWSTSSGLVVPAMGALGIAAAALLLGYRSLPTFHTVLDTASCLFSATLAFVFWTIGVQMRQHIAKYVAMAFGLTAILELTHLMSAVEWLGVSAAVETPNVLRPATWGPAAHVLPAGLLAALALLSRSKSAVITFGMALLALAVLLLVSFQLAPRYTEPQLLGLTRPALLGAPALWAIVGYVCLRLRSASRFFEALLTAAVLLTIANLVMLYSRAPHDGLAMAAHLGKAWGYFILLSAVLRATSQDTAARQEAEQALSRSHKELERRVLDRTAQLQQSNDALQAENVERRHAEDRAQAQLQRLNLLHHVTRAIGERQDLESIFQVVVGSVEEQLSVDFVCMCTYDRVDHALSVVHVGGRSRALAVTLGMEPPSHIRVEENGLSQCVQGHLVYEPDLTETSFPFPQRLAVGGLGSFVAAPLQVESQVFGILIAARRQPNGFSSGECEYLLQLSEHSALAAHQAQLFGALERAYEDLRITQNTVMQQERLRALGQMASGVAHDINNALSPVTLYTDLLLESEKGLSPRATSALEIIRRAAGDITHTVSRMRDFHRQNDPIDHVTSINLNDLIPQVLDLTRARWSDMAQERGIEIEMIPDLAMELPAVTGVESEIREALVNLIFNAVDAMPAGGQVTLRTRSVTSNQPSAQIEVADTGVGMDEETKKRCLEPFYTTKGERGSGLGLAMVFGIAQRHGADVEIESALGAGTIVRLAFPSAAPIEKQSGEKDDIASVRRRLRLLVIDDDPLLLNSLRDILESDGHAVTAAGEGAEGVDLFTAAVNALHPFDAVITDLGMPRMDGRRVAAALKEISPNTPVLLLTGWGRRLSVEETPPHVDMVLSKPPRPADLRRALSQYGHERLALASEAN